MKTVNNSHKQHDSILQDRRMYFIFLEERLGFVVFPHRHSMLHVTCLSYVSPVASAWTDDMYGFCVFLTWFPNLLRTRLRSWTDELTGCHEGK